jgi:hypothetical protein
LWAPDPGHSVDDKAPRKSSGGDGHLAAAYRAGIRFDAPRPSPADDRSRGEASPEEDFWSR